MNCPKCSIELKSIMAENIKLETCPSCEGIWLDKFEISKISTIEIEKLNSSEIAQSLTKNNPPKQTNHKALICPYCSSEMDTFNYSLDSGVNIDICGHCSGTWLDDGELKDIIEYIKNKRASLPEIKMLEIKTRLEESKNSINKAGLSEILALYLRHAFKFIYSKDYKGF